MKEHMNDSTSSANTGDAAVRAGAPDAARAQASDRVLSRRRLLRAGIAATPVVLTLASRPAMATQDHAPSVGLSGNISFYGECPPEPCGKSPGYWKQEHHFDDWYHPYTPGTKKTVWKDGKKTTTYVNGTKFLDVFLVASSDAIKFNGKTFLDVLNMSGGGIIALAREAIAILLSASNPDYFVWYSPDTVIYMFNTIAAGGSFVHHGQVINSIDKLKDILDDQHD